MVVALSVIAVVGGVGVVTLDRERILTGFGVAAVVLIINVVVVTIRGWHRGNTRLDTAYVPAEDVVRLRAPRAGREAAKR